NVAGYDLPKLITGAFGTLGVITRAVFRLHPLPRRTRSFSIPAVNPDEVQKLTLGIQDSKLAHVALQTHSSAETPPSIDILFEGRPDNLHRALITLRADLEKMGGSLVLLHRPATLPPFDAWGTLGDSLPLMKAVKHQLDPRSTLNLGRFLGGI